MLHIISNSKFFTSSSFVHFAYTYSLCLFLSLSLHFYFFFVSFNSSFALINHNGDVDVTDRERRDIIDVASKDAHDDSRPAFRSDVTSPPPLPHHAPVIVVLTRSARPCLSCSRHRLLYSRCLWPLRPARCPSARELIFLLWSSSFCITND